MRRPRLLLRLRLLTEPSQEDAPMTHNNPAALASSAAEAIRALNHATLDAHGRDGWTYPGDAYDVIGALDRMAGGLNQALEQVWMLLSGLAADGHVRSDRGDIDQPMTEARAALDDARAAADRLTVALSRAHAATSPLAWQD